MSPEELKALRKELGCSARELAAVLEVTAETVLAWEKGELFPTKKYVDRLGELRREGPSAVPRRSKKKKTPLELLGDPQLWEVFRKILVHDELRAQVLKLSDKYDDPEE